MMAMVFFDVFGRRTLVLHGGWTQGAFLMAIGALGRLSNPTRSESNGVVAGMQLYTCILHMTLGPGAYITAAEVGTQTLREKTMAISVSPRFSGHHLYITDQAIDGDECRCGIRGCLLHTVPPR